MPLFRRGEAASTLDLLVVGLGNPGPAARARPPQRRLHGRRRARPPPRRAPSRASSAATLADVAHRRQAPRAAQAGHLHERLRPLGAAGGRVLQDAARRACSSSTTRSTSTLGRLQARLGGGLAGHNGLRSIAGRLGSPDFLRLRVGVGRPGRGDPRDVADFVLAPFAPEDDAEATRRARGRRRRVARDGRPRGDAAPLQLRRAPLPGARERRHASRGRSRREAGTEAAHARHTLGRYRACRGAEVPPGGGWSEVGSGAGAVEEPTVERRRGPVTMRARGTPVPAVRADPRATLERASTPRAARSRRIPPWTRRPLHAFIAELAASERFQAFTRRLPGRARVSEAALPLVLATLHEELGRGLLILLPEDADARDAAEGASWFLGADQRRAAPEPRRLARLRPRAAAAPRRRARPRPRRPRRRRPRVRVRGRARRGHAARSSAARSRSGS